MREVIEHAQEVLHGSQIKAIAHAVHATWARHIYTGIHVRF